MYRKDLLKDAYISKGSGRTIPVYGRIISEKNIIPKKKRNCAKKPFIDRMDDGDDDELYFSDEKEDEDSDSAEEDEDSNLSFNEFENNNKDVQKLSWEFELFSEKSDKKSKIRMKDISNPPKMEICCNNLFLNQWSEIICFILCAQLYEEIQEIKKHEDKIYLELGVVPQKVYDKVHRIIKSDFSKDLKNYTEKFKQKSGRKFILGISKKCEIISQKYYLNEFEKNESQNLILQRDIQKSIGGQDIILKGNITELYLKFKKIKKDWGIFYVRARIRWLRKDSSNGKTVWNVVSSW